MTAAGGRVPGRETAAIDANQVKEAYEQAPASDTRDLFVIGDTTRH